MMRAGVRAMAVLASASSLLVTVSVAHGQGGGHNRGQGGGGGRNRGAPTQTRPSAPASPEEKEELPAGEYSLDFDKALQAVNRGEGRDALAYYERVAVEAEQQGDRLRAAQAGHAASATATRLGLYQKAIRSGMHALELFEAIGIASLPPLEMARVGSTYAQIGAAYRNAGDLAAARKVLEEGLAFSASHLTGRRENIVTGFLSNTLAKVAYAQRDYQTALAQATRAAHWFDDVAAQLPPRGAERRKLNLTRRTTQSLIIAARAQLALGHPDEAEAVLDRALKSARQIGSTTLEADVLQNQGAVALSRRDWTKALMAYEQGIALANRIRRTDSLIWLNEGLSRALTGLGRTDEALVAARESMRRVEEIRAELGDSDLRSDYLENKQAIYQRAIRLALATQRPDEALAFAERSRARAFLDLLGNRTTLSKGRTRGLVDEETKLRARLAEAQARAQVGGSEDSGGSQAVVETADQDYRAFLDRVRKENLEQASLMTVEPVTLPEIQRLLPERTTLLEYLVGEDDVILWVVDRQSVKAIRIPIGRQALLGEIRHFRSAIARQAAVADVSAQAQALYDRLVEPGRGDIRGDQLLIVPHGPLHYVPFAALRSRGGRWLVEDFALSTLPSASVLRFLGGKGAATSGAALVVGNPDIGAGLTLRWAEREARMVGQHDAGATVLVRADATELEVKKRLGGAPLVHFATHAELSESDPLASALLLVPGGGEDGRLEVRELFGLDLHARLVVLSACQTGLGKLSHGDELIGLLRAFIYAGTPAVVTTLWSVDDRASYELVRAFYERLERVGAVEALRQAQTEAMRAFPHPFAWAGFGLTGAPR